VIDELQMPVEDDVRIVSGRIRNRGQVGCYSPQVIIGVYGTDGKVLREEHETPEETFQKVLEGGQSVPFKLKVYPDTGLGGTIGSLKAWADCLEPY
jgi:methylaspartate ammonia-lyase